METFSQGKPRLSVIVAKPAGVILALKTVPVGKRRTTGQRIIASSQPSEQICVVE